MSKAFVNVVSALTMAGFCAETLKKHYDGSGRKAIPALCDRTWKQVKEARKLWPESTHAQAEQVAKRMLFFRDHAPCVSLIQLTSMALALLDDVESHLTDKRRRKAIERISRTVMAIHRYFDRKQDKDAEYEAASRVVNEWKKMLEAA